MIATGQFTADAVGDANPYTIEFPCRKVTLREEDGNATLGYTVRAPRPGSPPRFYVPGEPCVLERGGGFMPDQIVAYISVAAGSLDFEVLYE